MNAHFSHFLHHSQWLIGSLQDMNSGRNGFNDSSVQKIRVICSHTDRLYAHTYEMQEDLWGPYKKRITVQCAVYSIAYHIIAQYYIIAVVYIIVPEFPTYCWGGSRHWRRHRQTAVRTPMRVRGRPTICRTGGWPIV
jgi:hypothetical protein